MISYTAKVKCKSWLERDLNAIQARMCSVSILLQNHPQRNMKRKFLTWFLTLPKSSVKVDSSETWTRNFGTPVRRSTYWANRNYKRVSFLKLGWLLIGSLSGAYFKSSVCANVSGIWVSSWCFETRSWCRRSNDLKHSSRLQHVAICKAKFGGQVTWSSQCYIFFLNWRNSWRHTCSYTQPKIMSLLFNNIVNNCKQ